MGVAWNRFERMSMYIMASFVCNFTLLILLAAVGSPVPNSQHTILIIAGGTGDLATKYLWQSVFDVYVSATDGKVEESSWRSMPPRNHTFDFYAAGRSNQDKGNVILNRILTTGIKCDKDETSSEGITALTCRQRLTEFVDKVIYVTLDNEEDFMVICSEMTHKFSNIPSATTKELVLFMAIPPSAYDTFVHRFNKYCSTLRSRNVSIKLALEKPFGLDKTSAEVMSKKLLSYFEEEEIYRVDHYLGKPVVKAILTFRNLNPDLEKVLNTDYVDRVEIFLKETVDVEERFDVYNTMGVLRDIHQNHLTQLLVLVAMDLPTDLSNNINIHQNKERLLKQLDPVGRYNSLFGQYENYAANAELHEINNTNTIPTFAASIVKINSPRWRSVPFLLVSGKQLDVRESYIRIVFKNNFVCVSNCEDKKLEEKTKYTEQIIFHIGHGRLKKPSILVSKSLKTAKCPTNFKENLDFYSPATALVYGEVAKNFVCCTVLKDTAAYFSVFSDILAGRQEHFVSTNQLILSWQVWDYLVSSFKKIRVYESADPHGRLNFIIKINQLEFVYDDHHAQETDENAEIIFHSEGAHTIMQTPATFLGHKLITSDSDHLAFILAQDIDRAAALDIQAKGSFHIAFSGGTSLHKVFQILAQSFANLHWHSIHVWQVDERCVPHHNEQSNFQMLDRELLRFVDIPYSNIHAMPVYTGSRLCDPELGGAHAYADSLRHIVPNSQLDFIVLGLGTDGHTASLFPKSRDLLVDSNTFVITTEDGPPDSAHRMTMTLPWINRSKRVSIFVTGKHKREILNKLENETSNSVEEFPILGVNPVNGTVCWYIDYSAYTTE